MEIIEPGLIDRVWAKLQKLELSSSSFAIISNTTVGPLYGEALAKQLPGAKLLQIPDGEKHKTLETVRGLYESMLEHGMDRQSLVIALGGGVVGDIAGFVAATYMRGVRLVQMPTTLLAMVDSSVGGKVGVDLPQGKNLVGAFKQPEAVLVDPDVLSTLPEAEYRNGLAEVIKHGLLDDGALLDPKMYIRGRAPELIARAVDVKLKVVKVDPFERGPRKHLNLGHTFAHAIEQQSHFAWKHGEAVAVGLLAAAQLSERIGLAKVPMSESVQELLEHVGLPVQIKGMTSEGLLEAMRTDKKWEAGKSRFILLEAPGVPKIVEDVPRAQVLEVLEGLCTLCG